MDAVVGTAAPRAPRRWWTRGGRSLRLLAGGACLWMLASAPVPVAAAEPDAALARVVKAVFLYKFLNYAEWPAATFAQPETPYVIGVYGADEIAAELAQLAAGRTVADRPVQIRKVRRGDPLTGVHLLFVGATENAQLGALARAARTQGILVVSEDPGGLAQGSAINLLIVDGRVRFDVALDAAEKAGVRLSSRLLGVARSVRAAGGGT